MQINEMIEKATGLCCPVTRNNCRLYNEPEISSIIRHGQPYLVLTHAIYGRTNSSESFLFARASFPESDCSGHYPGFPSLPLTEIGRSMDQAAALFTSLSRSDMSGGIPLLNRITKLKGGSIERYDSAEPCWIWVSNHNSETRTIFYLDSKPSPYATIEGWSYDFISDNDFNSIISENKKAKKEHAVSGLDRLEIMKLIPQTPPFLILDSVHISSENNGNANILAQASVLQKMKNGHLGLNTLLGPMHLSRALAQSGMVLCAQALPFSDFIPEVSSAYGIWYDTRSYFQSDNIIVHARIDKFSSKRLLNMAQVSGSVYCEGREVYGADCLNYILIPREAHPAGIAG
ncbi:MAG: hypothetical protein HGB36_05140 [Chlorobiaceae bacterium]|jgi:3-hydroxymyristoyl/3-hydroxydecanoyl-(acyl carrier protein) dehydratase|nr:hypothetical protein [Chlorobiaceae bacterium]